MNQNEKHIIKHGGKYYVGTVSDYIRLSHRSGFDKNPTGIPDANQTDIEAYAYRRIKSQQTKIEAGLDPERLK